MEGINILKGQVRQNGWNGSHGCGECWRTSENAQEEILHNIYNPITIVIMIAIGTVKDGLSVPIISFNYGGQLWMP